MILLALVVCLVLIVAFGVRQFVISAPHYSDLESRYGWDKESAKPTKLDKLIKAYMAQDALDPTSTINFLIEVDGLEDPFAEALMLPPPKPKDAATSARPPRYQKKNVGNATMYSVMDDLMRAYSVPTHSLQCQLCGQIGSFSGGACHACGGRATATHPSWAIWSDDGSVVDYFDKRKMEVDAYQLQKQGKKITIFDSNGKQLFVAPPPQLFKEEMKQLRDNKGRFKKKEKACSIHPLDEPYPIERITPWPGETVRG